MVVWTYCKLSTGSLNDKKLSDLKKDNETYE